MPFGLYCSDMLGVYVHACKLIQQTFSFICIGGCTSTNGIYSKDFFFICIGGCTVPLLMEFTAKTFSFICTGGCTSTNGIYSKDFFFYLYWWLYPSCFYTRPLCSLLSPSCKQQSTDNYIAQYHPLPWQPLFPL